MTRALILASGSPYRAQLLARLELPFESIAPDIDETPRAGETPSNLSQRLAREKAARIAALQPAAVIVGSDQCAALDGRILGKPGGREQALAQLRAASARAVEFLTAVAVRVPGRATPLTHLDRTRVGFRPLSEPEIERYVDRERPFDCAGAFRAEALGIALFERIDAADPTALIGLPLIALSAMLREAGFEIP